MPKCDFKKVALHGGLVIKLRVKEQKQPSRGVLRKRCSENMQQIYRRTPMPKCDLNEVAKLSNLRLLFAFA